MEAAHHLPCLLRIGLGLGSHYQSWDSSSAACHCGVMQGSFQTRSYLLATGDINLEMENSRYIRAEREAYG